MDVEHRPDHLALAQEAIAAGRHAIAAEHAAAATQESADPEVRASALELVAELNLTLGRPYEALEWVEQLREHRGRTLTTSLLEAAACLQLDDPAGVIDLLDGLEDLDLPEALTTVHELRSQALLASGCGEEAAAEVRALLRTEPGHAAGWHMLAVLCDAGHLDPGPIVAELPDDEVLNALGALVGAPPSGADQVAERLWKRRPGDPRLLAFLAVLGGELPLARALEWSARLRQHGAGEHCPLLGLAADERRLPSERIRAAATASATFGDGRAEPLAELAVGAVADTELAAVVEEVALLAPALVDGVIVAAATSTTRSLRLAGLACAHGDGRGAVALARHAVEQAESDAAVLRAALASSCSPATVDALLDHARDHRADDLETALAHAHMKS